MARRIGDKHLVVALEGVKRWTEKPLPGPWQYMWKGKHWYDMPGSDSDDKKLTFWLFRRNMVDPFRSKRERNAEQFAAPRTKLT